MSPEPGHTEDHIEHEPPPEQANPGPPPKRQEKVKFHPYINGKEFF